MAATAATLDDTTTNRTDATEYCTAQYPDEPLYLYSARVLTYALQLGIEPLSLSQLETADAAAMQAATTPRGKLDADAARLDTTLHTLRLRIAARMQQQRAQRAQLQRLMEQLGQEEAQEENAPQNGASMVEMSDAERAAQLLKAALTLIMSPGDSGNGGGTKARLIPPTPRLPPGGNALPTPAPSAPAPRRF